MLTLTHLREGLRIFLASWKAKYRGFRLYQGTPEQIARAIIQNCWNGRYFQTSTRNFAEFWTRDFGICAEALVQLGYREKVVLTVRYALNAFKKANTITTTITPSGVPIDCFSFASDSLPWFLHRINAAQASFLVEENRTFFEERIKEYYQKVVDSHTGLVRADRVFSGMRDYAKRRSSCYDNCMVYFLGETCRRLKLTIPWNNKKLQKHIEHTFWNGTYFYDDLNKRAIVVCDAQVFPFWTGVCSDTKKLRSCVEAMERTGLTAPWPLKYTAQREKDEQWFFSELLVKNYETNSIWMNLGLCYLDVLKKYDQKRFRVHLEQYSKLIEKHQTFLEVYDQNESPFSTTFYLADEGMLWVSKWLWLKEKVKRK